MMTETTELTPEDLQRIYRRRKRLSIWWNIGAVATVALTAGFAREHRSSELAGPSIDNFARAELQFIMRPYIILPYLVFWAYGFREVWKARDDWKYDTNLRWIFLALVVSACVLVVAAIRLYVL
jgi:hypothetical protein